MEIREIELFVEEEIKRLDLYYKNKNKSEFEMVAGFKIIEELGELFSEVLAHKGYQRKEKLEKLDKEEIKKEFADLIFTVLILAKRFNINIEEAIKTKMEEIKKRKY